PGWALASTRAARAAGWAFEPGLAARRLEHEHPKNVGAAFVQMGAVLAWYQGARGYVLLTYGDTASRLAERLPDVALIDLAGGDDLSARLPPASAMREVQAPGPGPQGSEPARPKRASGSTPSVRDLQPRDPLLLVSGGPRSGTTMLRNMLAAHPLLAAPLDEGFFVTQVFGEMKLAHRTDDVAWAWELTKAHRFFQAWDLDTEALDAVIAERPPASYADLLRVLFAALAAREHKPFSMDKCTAYSLHWEWLAEQFPTTRFALIVRDPREVCMSQAVQYFSHGGVAGAAWWWLFHVMGTKKVAAALGDRWLEIRYEDLVADPVKQLDALCRHAGIEFDEAMLRYPDAGSKPVSVLHHAASQAPRQDLRSWRGALSHDDLVTIERITGPVMTRFGYEPETRGITPGAVDMTARYLVKEARNQWLLSGAPRPSALENFLGLKWKHQQ
ncbi:MAG: sulfotransferase, partial [Acidimicrobiaceae bacterium]|nr:sulfotransferase [Acidimicrobiaceae bacterium]